MPAFAGPSAWPLRVGALVAFLGVACAAPAPPSARPLARPGAPTRSAPATRPAAPRPSTLPSHGYVMAPSLNLRRCPAVECSRLAVLPQNEVVLRLREDGEWVEVRVVRTGETGWVAARFLAEYPVAEPPKPATPGRPAPGDPFTEEFLE